MLDILATARQASGTDGHRSVYRVGGGVNSVFVQSELLFCGISGMSAGRFFREQSLVIVHVSTTCDEQQVCVSRESAEIIELAWIFVDASSLEERTRGSVLVRPVNTPVTDLCSTSTSSYVNGETATDNCSANTTTLTWSDLENAGTLKEALGIVDAAIRGATTSKDVSFSFIVLDPFDLRVQIPREARDKSLALPTYLQHPRLYDLRSEYGKWQRIHPEAMLFNPGSLSNICAALDVDTTDLIHGGHSHLSNPQAQFALTEGHSALDHCTIIHRILRALIKRSEPVEQHSTLFKFPVDAKADITSFFEEKSKVLHLSGLAYDTTQSELESWFTQHGGRPIAFWTLRTPDQHKPSGTGYAIFSSHQEASDSLTMNGRALGDRTIEVSPSSPRVLDRAAEILTPFPVLRPTQISSCFQLTENQPSKNRPRPGDWTCPSCGFSNFQRRTACFRCTHETFCFTPAHLLTNFS